MLPTNHIVWQLELIANFGQIYTVIVAILYMHIIMIHWCDSFWAKMCKIYNFFYFILANAIALSNLTDNCQISVFH